MQLLINGDDYLGQTDPNENHPFSHSNSSLAHESSGSDSLNVREKVLLDIKDKLGESIKRVLVIDDDHDSAFSVKTCLESYHKETELSDGSECAAIHVTMYVDPRKALLEFKSYYYDLLLVDINMPTVNGYELCEKLLKLDLNIKVCFMSSGEINDEALREIHHPVKSFGCFIKKPATKDYLIKRVLQEIC